ncbi:helix-turn-helix transcriptional regulator [Pimelobacter simplex]|uniref:helix-turn-helix transcriptional regulator n=1 Tax=Nocardioides simplex TaxID=2045 RepID=UPI0021500E32|nr:helix-turn-helix domain-containing protein [Pimelobacter simplex]UUW90623.1 helix-turn-helix domain-containing protein [Pimelobacter simplex]UUW94452.1 helix-turn-helix domain-containing protein [Pimelobacter simplex]
MIATNAEQMGALVKQARLRAAMSQADLAALVGVTRQWVIAFESGSPTSRIGLAIRAVQAVGLAVDLVDTEQDPFRGIFGG